MANARAQTQIAEFPIRVVAERTGLTPAALRAWERRYAVVEPARSGGSQRLYSSADVERLKLIAGLAAQGHGLGALAKRSTESLKKMAGRTAAGNAGDRSPRERAVIDRLMADTRAFDPGALRATLTASVQDIGVDVTFERVVAPFLTRIGEDWACGEASVAHEHLASSVVRDLLGGILQSITAAGSAPALIAATIAGETHEFGTLMAAIAAARVGWRVVYLGANVPAEDIARAARAARARVIMLGLVAAEGVEHDVRGETAALRTAVGSRTRIVAGGAGTATNVLSLRRAGVETIESRDDLIALLQSLWKGSSAA